jgi:hypothetical protein
MFLLLPIPALAPCHQMPACILVTMRDLQPIPLIHIQLRIPQQNANILALLDTLGMDRVVYAIQVRIVRRIPAKELNAITDAIWKMEQKDVTRNHHSLK